MLTAHATILCVAQSWRQFQTGIWLLWSCPFRNETRYVQLYLKIVELLFYEDKNSSGSHFCIKVWATSQRWNLVWTRRLLSCFYVIHNRIHCGLNVTQIILKNDVGIKATLDTVSGAVLCDLDITVFIGRKLQFKIPYNLFYFQNIINMHILCLGYLWLHFRV